MPHSHSLLADLNAEQRRAVEYSDGPLLVLAGPGSGKTRVITYRIALAILSNRVAPERILGVTFTTRAAQEMKARVHALVGDETPLRLGTFHWVCHALLRRYGDRIGRRRDFRLLGPAEARETFRRVIPGGPRSSAASLLAAVAAVKNGTTLQDVSQRHGIDAAAIRAARSRYETELIALNALDLDDLLALAVRLLEASEETRRACRAQYDEILVDEYQDTNPVQQALLRLLAPVSRQVVAVGDEDQSIYAWREADSKAMQRFLTDFPSAALVKLERSYRSTKNIVRAATTLVQHNEDRIGLTLRAENAAGSRPQCFVADDEREEADWVAEEIAQLVKRRGYDYDGIAVLYRVNVQSRALEDALVRRQIPYHIHAGARYYDRPEIRRVLSYLRLALADDDEAASWLVRDTPGIGPVRLEVMREAARAAGRSLLEMFGEPVSGVPQQSLDRLAEVKRSTERLRAMRYGSLEQVVDLAIQAAGSDLGAAAAANDVADNLNELRTIVNESGARRDSLRDFIDRLNLSDPASGRGAGVTLMTIHAAKGLEFPVVFLAGVEEGLLPHRRSLDREEWVAEERRLCYVGMTRARDLLYLSYAHNRSLGGSSSLGHPSRFIHEMGTANLTVQFSPRRARKPRLASVHVGDRVVHPRWQTGVVVGVEGKGRDTLVTIQFDEAGRHRLQLCHAPLRRVGGENVNVAAG